MFSPEQFLSEGTSSELATSLDLASGYTAEEHWTDYSLTEDGVTVALAAPTVAQKTRFAGSSAASDDWFAQIRHPKSMVRRRIRMKEEQQQQQQHRQQEDSHHQSGHSGSHGTSSTGSTSAWTSNFSSEGLDSLMFSSPQRLSFFLENRHLYFNGAGRLPQWSLILGNGLAAQRGIPEPLETTGLIIAVCLNVAVGPPDIDRSQPSACIEAWLDPTTLPSYRAASEICEQIQSQFSKWTLGADPDALTVTRLADGTPKELEHRCTQMRSQCGEDRVLFHYNGHGVPRPTQNGEIWMFDQHMTEYLPVPIVKVFEWLSQDSKTLVYQPCVFVLDCSAAGRMVTKLETHLESTLQVSGSENNVIVLGACADTEVLLTNPSWPADLFTACLTTPIRVALRLFVENHPWLDVSSTVIDLFFSPSVGGSKDDLRSPLGELHWIFKAVIESIAWDLLPSHRFERLFRGDQIVPALMRHFIFAERVLKSMKRNPTSYPKIPPSHAHPMWLSWDYALEQSVLQLRDWAIAASVTPQGTAVVTSESLAKKAALKDGSAASKDGSDQSEKKKKKKKKKKGADKKKGGKSKGVSSLLGDWQKNNFFEMQLRDFECWLNSQQSEAEECPPHLPIALQLLLSKEHRSKCINLLAQYMDYGPWAVDYVIAVGMCPYFGQLLTKRSRRKMADDVQTALCFIWAKLVSHSDMLLTELVNESIETEMGQCTFFIDLLTESNSTSVVLMATYVLSQILKIGKDGYDALFTNSDDSDSSDDCLLSVLRKQLRHSIHGIRQWSVLCLAQYWRCFEKGSMMVSFNIEILAEVLSLLNEEIPEVRGSALYAICAFVSGFERCHRKSHESTMDDPSSSSSPKTTKSGGRRGSKRILELEEPAETTIVKIGRYAAKCMSDGSPLVRMELCHTICIIIRHFLAGFARVKQRINSEHRSKQAAKDQALSPTPGPDSPPITDSSSSVGASAAAIAAAAAVVASKSELAMSDTPLAQSFSAKPGDASHTLVRGMVEEDSSAVGASSSSSSSSSSATSPSSAPSPDSDEEIEFRNRVAIYRATLSMSHDSMVEIAEAATYLRQIVSQEAERLEQAEMKDSSGKASGPSPKSLPSSSRISTTTAVTRTRRGVVGGTPSAAPFATASSSSSSGGSSGSSSSSMTKPVLHKRVSDSLGVTVPSDTMLRLGKSELFEWCTLFFRRQLRRAMNDKPDPLYQELYPSRLPSSDPQSSPTGAWADRRRMFRGALAMQSSIPDYGSTPMEELDDESVPPPLQHLSSEVSAIVPGLVVESSSLASGIIAGGIGGSSHDWSSSVTAAASSTDYMTVASQRGWNTRRGLVIANQCRAFWSEFIECLPHSSSKATKLLLGQAPDDLSLGSPAVGSIGKHPRKPSYSSKIADKSSVSAVGVTGVVGGSSSSSSSSSSSMTSSLVTLDEFRAKNGGASAEHALYDSLQKAGLSTGDAMVDGGPGSSLMNGGNASNADWFRIDSSLGSDFYRALQQHKTTTMSSTEAAVYLKTHLDISKQVALYDTDSESITAVGLHPLDDVVYAADSKCRLWVWDYASHSVLNVISPPMSSVAGRLHKRRITHLECLNEFHDCLLSASTDDGYIRLYRNCHLDKSATLVTAFHGHNNLKKTSSSGGMPYCITYFSPYSTGLMAAGGSDSTVRIWDCAYEKWIGSLQITADSSGGAGAGGGGTGPTSASPTSDRRLLVSSMCGVPGSMNSLAIGSTDGCIRIFDMRDSQKASGMIGRDSFKVKAHGKSPVISVKGHRSMIASAGKTSIALFDPRRMDTPVNERSLTRAINCFSAHEFAPLNCWGNRQASVDVHSTIGDGWQQMSEVKYLEGGFRGKRIPPVKHVVFHKYKVLLAVAGGSSYLSLYSSCFV